MISVHQIRRCRTRETRSRMYDVGWEMKWLVKYMQVPPEGALPCVGCVLVRVRCLFEALSCSRQATFYLRHSDSDSDDNQPPCLPVALCCVARSPCHTFFVQYMLLEYVQNVCFAHLVYGKVGFGEAESFQKSLVHLVHIVLLVHEVNQVHYFEHTFTLSPSSTSTVRRPRLAPMATKDASFASHDHH